MALEKTLPIVALFLIGLLLAWKHILRPEHAPLISKLIVTVVLPATIIHSLAQVPLAPAMLLLPVAGLVLVSVLLGLGSVLAPVLGLSHGTRGAFLVAFPTLELGSIGYAFLLAWYGPSGLATIALLDLGNGLFIFTVVPLLAQLLGRSDERLRLSTQVMRYLHNPVLWSYLVGAALGVWHVRIPVLSEVFAELAQSLLLLLMLLVATQLSFEWSWSSLALPLVTIYLKTGIGILVALVVSWAFHFSGMTRVAVVLAASLPASLVTVVYAREQGLDTRYLCTMLSLALPLSLVTSSLVMTLAQ